MIDAMLCNKNCYVNMIDCKKVEFTVYNKCANVYTDVDGAYFITAAYLRMMNERLFLTSNQNCAKCGLPSGSQTSTRPLPGSGPFRFLRGGPSFSDGAGTELEK